RRSTSAKMYRPNDTGLNAYARVRLRQSAGMVATDGRIFLAAAIRRPEVYGAIGASLFRGGIGSGIHLGIDPPIRTQAISLARTFLRMADPRHSPPRPAVCHLLRIA